MTQASIKTNIKMRVTPKQSEKILKICEAHEFDIIPPLDVGFHFIHAHSINYMPVGTEDFFISHRYQEVDADLFISTNGTCEPTTNRHTNKTKG